MILGKKLDFGYFRASISNSDWSIGVNKISLGQYRVFYIKFICIFSINISKMITCLLATAAE